MKRKIKDFVLVADAFGPLPMWSLQHPTKEIKDCFMIYQVLDTPKKKWPKWMKKLAEIEKYCNKLTKDLMDVEAYVSGEVVYSNKYDGKKSRHILDLKIGFVDIRGWYPTGGDSSE